MKNFQKIILLSLAPLVLLGSSIQNSDTRKIMHSVFASVNTLLPLSVKLEDFSNPKNVGTIKKQLTILNENVGILSKHVASTSNESNKIAALNLAYDIEELNALYKSADYARARYVLHGLTENCVNCHTRLKNESVGQGLQVHFSEKNKLGLTGFDLAHFMVMGRRFDDALNAYEAEFRRDPSTLDSQSFFEYMRLAIRVKFDLKRVSNFLGSLSRDLQKNVELYEVLRNWQMAIADIEKMNVPRNFNLATAESLLKKAGVINDYPSDESGLPYLLSASHIFHTLLDSNKNSPENLSEIYYLLGCTEGYLSMTSWIRDQDLYFEQSIRANPKSKWARKSLVAIMNNFQLDYTEPSEPIDSEVQAKLKELRALIDNANKK